LCTCCRTHTGSPPTSSFKPPPTTTTSTPTSSPPTRGVLILPGLGNNAADYDDLAARLRARGLGVAVAPVSRLDWSRNAAALSDADWWRGTLRPRPAVDWYLEKVGAALDGLKREVSGAPVTLLTHSAGGWLGRVYLHDFGTAGVDRFVSLGSPHAPPPAGAEGVVDQTRGILTYCSETFPGAHHPEVRRCDALRLGAPCFGGGVRVRVALRWSLWLVGAGVLVGEGRAGGQAYDGVHSHLNSTPNPRKLRATPPARAQVKYVTVAGRYVRGVPLTGQGSLKAKFAGAGYQQVCGSAEVDGDFIVPTSAAHLPGAVNLEIEGCFHSPLGSKLPFLGPWYGSEEFIGAWVDWVDGDWGALSSGEVLSSSSSSEDEGSGVAAAPRVLVVGGLPSVQG